MAAESALVVCLVADLLDRSRIAGVARAVGTPIAFVSSPDELVANLTDTVRTVFIDLNDPKAHGLDAIGRVADARPEPTIIGFISHADDDGIKAATKAGCDEVLSRAQFFKRLSVVLAEAAER